MHFKKQWPSLLNDWKWHNYSSAFLHLEQTMLRCHTQLPVIIRESLIRWATEQTLLNILLYTNDTFLYWTVTVERWQEINVISCSCVFRAVTPFVKRTLRSKCSFCSNRVYMLQFVQFILFRDSLQSLTSRELILLMGSHNPVLSQQCSFKLKQIQ